ncbi:MAG: hypothetical protein ACYDGR_14530 [Candidatus Dormibacteria bacterium]
MLLPCPTPRRLKHALRALRPASRALVETFLYGDNGARTLLCRRLAELDRILAAEPGLRRHHRALEAAVLLSDLCLVGTHRDRLIDHDLDAGPAFEHAAAAASLLGHEPAPVRIAVALHHAPASSTHELALAVQRVNRAAAICPKVRRSGQRAPMGRPRPRLRVGLALVSTLAVSLSLASWASASGITAGPGNSLLVLSTALDQARVAMAGDTRGRAQLERQLAIDYHRRVVNAAARGNWSLARALQDTAIGWEHRASADIATQQPDARHDTGANSPGAAGSEASPTPAGSATSPGDSGPSGPAGSSTPPASPSQGQPPPGHGGTPPGQRGTPPGQRGTPPGQRGTPPGQGGTPPGQGGTPPGQGGTPPGQGGTPPGQGGSPHGNPSHVHGH